MRGGSAGRHEYEMARAIIASSSARARSVLSAVTSVGRC